MRNTIEIRGNGGVVAIDVSGYESETVRTGSDANWLVCRVRLTLGCISGEIPASFTTQDFVRFEAELRSLLQRAREQASFETHEQALDLKVTLSKTGHARIKGVAQSHSNPRVSLSFTLDSDLPALDEALKALSEVASRFPVRA